MVKKKDTWTNNILNIIVATIGLSYLFMPLDAIPDTVTFFGYLDDAVVFIVTFVIVKWAYVKIRKLWRLR